jgi:hypothetical protein
MDCVTDGVYVGVPVVDGVGAAVRVLDLLPSGVLVLERDRVAVVDADRPNDSVDVAVALTGVAVGDSDADGGAPVRLAVGDAPSEPL